MTDEQLAFYRRELDRCWPWLEAAVLTYGETHTKADVWEMIEDGRAQLWPTPNACMVTTISVMPTGFKEFTGWLSGGKLEEIVNSEPLMAAFAKSIGCHRVVVRGRRGWKKAFNGYREVATVIAKDL